MSSYTSLQEMSVTIALEGHLAMLAIDVVQKHHIWVGLGCFPPLAAYMAPIKDVPQGRGLEGYI